MQYSVGFVKYTKNLSSDTYKPLTIVEEQELLQAHSQGSKEAFDKIVNAYLRFVLFILKEFKIPDDVDVMDIVQEGNIGLIHGLSKFDVTRYSCRVSTYCVYWIRFFITKALSGYSTIRGIFVPLPEEDFVSNQPRVEGNYSVNISQDIIKHALQVLKDREKLVVIHFYGLKEPYTPKTLQEIASILHIHIERVRQIRDTALDKLNTDLISQISHTQ